jgi:hypothetical protein
MRRTIGIAALLIALAWVLPTAGAQAKVGRSFWGVEYTRPGIKARDFRTMHKGRVGIVRIVLWRSQAQADNWRSYDRIIGGLARRRIAVLPDLMGTQGNYTLPLGSQSAQQGWKQYVHSAVARYGPGGSYWSGPYHHQFGSRAKPKPVKNWQVWNEPSLPKYFPTNSPVKDYARLLNLSHDAIRGAAKHTRVVLAGLPGAVVDPPYRGWKYLNKLYRVKGVKHNFDIAAFHPYSRTVGSLHRQMKKFRRVMRRHRDRHSKVWVTEFGYGSARPNGRLNFGRKGQARMLHRTFKVLRHKHRRWNVRGVVWYQWRDPDNAGDANDCTFCASAGLLHANYRPKPAWRAFKRFTH